MPRHPTAQTNKHVRNVTNHYYTKNFNNQPTDFWQDERATITTTNHSKTQEEHPPDAPQLQANVPMQTTNDNHTTYTTKHHKKVPTPKKDVAIQLLSATRQLNKKDRMLYIPLQFR